MTALQRWTICIALALLGLAAAWAGAVPPAPPAVLTVYLVRHAEKDLAPGLADPPLTAAGQARACALARALRRAHPAALFTTNTLRTRATLAPLAAATGLAPRPYDARQPRALADTLRRAYAGRAVVVVGHSNTLLPLIAALGAPLPVPEIGDAEYRYLFEVRVPARGPATVRVRHYGAR
ncbi:histidine phosphatase family protein [Hymenobacter caeli]|uniref:Broad specificity phosphatase PhoE n=1 Tax=Hymenobacter caeli TaxID=2735894 RepID=A0ABX2FXA4_9BACT|nr:histidine phosphatase family protein [Hymenobacter caeli]NRT20914.1 broad specificity phosphatase PhoE [Hymenobacter caeli]